MCFQVNKVSDPGPRHGDHLTGGPQPIEKHARLPPQSREDIGKRTLVLDLDETLVHSSFKPVANCDFSLKVDMEGKLCDVFVVKRPGVDRFLEEVTKVFEVVVFTASISKYADPLLDCLDQHKAIKHRRYREACRIIDGDFVKDLRMLGRDLPKIVIVDNSPHCYMLQPTNAIPISTFIDNMEDRELATLLPRLQELARSPVKQASKQKLRNPRFESYGF